MTDSGFFQVSGKLTDGFIGVINAPDWAGFQLKLIEALGPEGADQVTEKLARSIIGNPADVVRTTHVPAEAPLTPVEVAAALGGTIDTPAPVCKHGEPARFFPAGIAKATGKPYKAFYKCARQKDEQCDFRANG